MSLSERRSVQRQFGQFRHSIIPPFSVPPSHLHPPFDTPPPAWRPSTSDFRFHARILYPGNQTAQLQWLTDQYLALAEDRSGAEVTATSFMGSSHSAQFLRAGGMFRNCTPVSQNASYQATASDGRPQA